MSVDAPALPTRAHPRRSTPRHFLPEVQGLRALAVLLVLVYHLSANVLPGGYVGVDVFFVISGFLITSLLLREIHAHGRVSISQFYIRRYVASCPRQHWYSSSLESLRSFCSPSRD